MAPHTYDFVIVGGGSAGSALANRLSADPGARVLVLEAGRPDYIWDPFIHMPAALTFPIGSRFYDWKYESEPEPHLNGRRIYHARGKVLGGSSSINGMIFQRGNPLDYERWAADAGMAEWDYAHCLPYFKRMENCLAAAPEGSVPRAHRAAGARAGAGHQPAVRRLLRRRAAGRLPAHRRRERLPAGGLHPLRPEHPPGQATVRRARLPVSRDEPTQPHRGQPRLRHEDHLPRERRSASSSGTKARSSGSGPPSSSWPAGPSTPRSCCSSPGSATPGSSPNSASTWSPTCPAWARTCRTTWRCTSSTARSCRSRSRPRSSGATAPWSARSGCSCGPGPAPPTTSRAAVSPAATTTSSTRT